MPNEGSISGECEYDKNKLKELIKSRGSIKGRLTRFKDYVSLLNKMKTSDIGEINIKELKLRHSKSENLFFEFNQIQGEIDMLLCSEDESEMEIFENTYYSTMSLAQHIIDSFDSNKDLHTGKSECSGSCSHNNQNNNIKLPTIKLPTFDGNYLKWLEFRDTSDSLIHSNESISKINKFHYLRSSLEGSAATIIKSIEFTAVNYTVAWGLICERSDCKRVLINNHLKSLLEIEPISVESHKAIRFLVDHVCKNIRALNSLDQPTDKWDVLIIYLISTKLDSVTFGKWEECKNNFKDLPALSDFMQFLRNRADILETMAMNRGDKREQKHSSSNRNTFEAHNKEKKSDNYKNNNHYFNRTSKSFVTSTDTRPGLTCSFCSKHHRIIDCFAFKQLSPERRCTEVSKLNLCLNCLRRGHAANECRLTCKTCKQKHNTLLHVARGEPENIQNSYVTKGAEANTTLNNLNNLPVSLTTQSSSQILLGTAVVEVVNPENKKTYLARALLDAGSQSSFMTTNLKHKMGLLGRNTDTLCISGINNTQTKISECCEIIIGSLANSFKANLKCLVIPEITGLLPNTSINISALNLPENIKLADPNFFHSSSVDLLLGAEIFFDIMSQNKIRLVGGRSS